MTTEDQFAIEIARAVLNAADEDVQLAVLDQMVEEEDGNLEEQITRAKAADKQAGDFGMEIIGPMIIPVLIAAGKALWKSYLKKLGEKAGEKAADYTIEKVKALLQAIWRGTEMHVTAADYELELRKAAIAEGLSTEQTERLAEAVKNVGRKNLP